MLQYIMLVYKNGVKAEFCENPEQLLNKVDENRIGVLTSVWVYDDHIETMDLVAIDKFEEDYRKWTEDVNMLREIKCPICRSNDNMRVIGTDTLHCMECDILIDTKVTCPDCGEYTYEYNTVEQDPGMGLYCCKSRKTISNQYMTHDDFLEDGKDYVDCTKILQDQLVLFKRETGMDIRDGMFDIAYENVNVMMNAGFECAENECDNCPIAHELKRSKYNIDDTADYITCGDFVEMYKKEHAVASEASN